MTSAGQVDRTPSLVEVLDRVLDRGIVIDAHARVSLMAIHVIDVEARIVVASVETYLEHGDAPASTGWTSRLGRMAGRPGEGPSGAGPSRGGRRENDGRGGVFFLVSFDPDPRR